MFGVYVSVTTVLGSVAGLPFQAALALGFVTALVVHFTLQRVFVWRHVEGFALSRRAQLSRYGVVAGTQYGATALVMGFVPRRLDLPPTAVYLVWAVAWAGASFVVLGRGVFHASRRGDREPKPGLPERPF